MLPLIAQYIAEGNAPDQPGRFIAWLTREPSTSTPGGWPDIGDDIGSRRHAARGRSEVYSLEVDTGTIP